MSTQLDLFPTTARIDEPVALDPESMRARVRPKLAAWLAEARAAQELPWPFPRARVVALLFHNMAGWLQREERAATRAEFVAELTRLGHADLAAAAAAEGFEAAQGVD